MKSTVTEGISIMRIFSFLSIAFAAALLSTAAVAQSTTGANTPPPDPAHGEVVPLGSNSQLADRCAALLIQFDGEIANHGDAAKAEKAKKLRASGEKQCKAGHHQDGIDNLTQALKNIGVKPRA
jgi:hypothetical protein